MKRSKAAGAAFALAAVLFWITLVIRWIAGDGALMAAEMLAAAPPERTGLAGAGRTGNRYCISMTMRKPTWRTSGG